MATPDDLWGGQLVGVAFDPVGHICKLQVATFVDGRSHAYLIDCRGVHELRFPNSIPEPWAYAEVTEAHSSFDQESGRHLLELVLWSEAAGLVVKCSSIDIRETGR
jgi:hypothetical protein